MKEGAVERLFRLREETYRRVLLYLMLCGSYPLLTNHAKLARAVDLTRHQARHAVDYLEAEGFISVSRGKDETAISIIGLAIEGSAIYDEMNRYIIDIEDNEDVAHEPAHNPAPMHEHNPAHMPAHKQETSETVTPIDDIVLPDYDVVHEPAHNPAPMHEHKQETEETVTPIDDIVLPGYIVEHKPEHKLEHMHEHNPSSDADSSKEANHGSN